MNQRPFTRIGIVADDLTSATDGAAPFLANGFAPMISRHNPGPVEAALVAIDTNSRALDAEQAARSTSAAVAALRDRSILFKTIDSTLRGHIREEISAAFAASGLKRLVVAPAFPGAGRLTIGGTQFVHGVPVSESDYGRDPVHPARTSQIAGLLDPALGVPLVLSVNAPEELFRSAAGARVAILDADSQAALDRQVARIVDAGAALWVGSPGLGDTARRASEPARSGRCR
jgi:D-threonate/D-erythronate kinase